MPDYFLQDDGSSKFTLDDSSGFLLLDPAGTPHTVNVNDTLAVTDAVEAGFLRRLSQLPVEVLVQGDPDARLSQLPVEVLQRVLHETVAVVIWE